MINFEAAPVSSEFMREVFLPTLASLPRPPNLFFRLWYMYNPRELCDWIEQYPGHCMVGHKIVETMDAYNYPAVDSRIRDWRKIFESRGLKVEWNYIMGPCHNCGSNISRRLWSDPEFIYTLLAKARAAGADGINFHTVYELLADCFESSPVVDSDERAIASLNRFHLEAFVDFVRGGAFDEHRIVTWHAHHFALDRRDAWRAYRVLRDTSRAEILHLLQFPLTTHEGYAVDARRQLSQHPLFHPPVNFLLNNQYRQDPHHLWCYLNKTVKDRSYPDDFQPLIDYADPTKKKTKRNPARLASEMEHLGTRAFLGAKRLRRHMGGRFVEEVASNQRLAAVCAHDIRAGIALFRLYFASGRAAALNHVRRAIAELKAVKRIVDAYGPPSIHMHEGHDPDPDIKALRRLQRHLEQPHP